MTEPPERSRDDPPARSLAEGRLGRYEVHERLGAGGMGEVYRAWDSLLHRWVALKRPAPGAASDDAARRRLLREARAASALQHPAIAAIFDVLEIDGEVAIVEEFVVGVPLRDRIGTPFEPATFFAIAEACAAGLASAEEKGIVHCDLKPENILIQPDGSPKILDFGIARRTAPTGAPSTEAITIDVTRSAAISGTPAYLAPEMIAGTEPDGRADQFAFGIVLYEMLTGTNPFAKETAAAALTSVLRDEPAPPSAINRAVSPALDALVLRLLQKDPAGRFARASDLVRGLGEARAGAAPARAPASGAPRPLRARVVRAAIAALAIAGATAALALLLADRARRPPDRAAITHRYLAVAPFKNLSEDSQSEFFAVGLTEALQTRLAGLTGIYIVDAAADVGAKLFLEGGVQRWTDRLRITYRLVDRTVGVNVGAGVVEGAIEQLFRLQDQTAEEIAKDLAAHYNLPPPPSGTAEIGARPTGDVAAYDLYLQARGYLLRYQDERSVDIAIDLFQKALDRDAEMPLALAGLGEAYWKRYETTKDSTWAAEAERTAIAALEIGASLPEPHVTLGTIYFGTGKAENAAAAFRRALDLDARSDAAYRGLAKAEEALGLADSAEATFRRAIAARPDYWAGHNDLGGFYYRHGQVEKAVDCFRRVIELTPDNARGYSNLGAMYASQNRSQEAIASYERSLALKPNFRAYSNLATLYRSLGRTEEAAAMYEKALALDDRDYRVWGSLGGTYLDIAGRRAGADSALDRAIVLAEKQRAINPNDPLLLAVLSQFHAARGQRADAQRLVARALELAPEQTDVLMHATVTYELIGDRGRAVDTLGRAIRSGYAVEALEREGALRALLADEEGQRAIREAVAARLLPGP